MTNPLEYDEASIIVELEELGEAEVRRRLNAKLFTLVYDEPARRWIEAIDRASAEESERRRDASQAEQIDIARSAKDAAWAAARAAKKANTIATIAVVMAIIAIIISTFAWIYPHR